MPQIIVVEEHDQVYEDWRARGLTDIHLCHVDFHADIRGLMIDRARQVAWPTTRRELKSVDAGNFLTHAILEGRVTAMRWFHAAHGGRRHDPHSVHYERDLSALPARIRHAIRPAREVPLRFVELEMRHWGGPLPGEVLDIDWDAFAAVEYSDEERERLIAQFFAADFSHVPELTYVVFSPQYVPADRAPFEAFIARLAALFQAEVTHVPPRAPQPEVPYHPVKKLIMRTSHLIPVPLKRVKRRLADALRAHDTRHDLTFFAPCANHGNEAPSRPENDGTRRAESQPSQQDLPLSCTGGHGTSA